MRPFPTSAESDNSLEVYPPIDGTRTTSSSEGHDDELKDVAVHDRDYEKGSHVHLERTHTGSTMQTLSKTATGQAQIGADEDPRINMKTFLACLAISFLWTGSQVPLYMLLVSNNYTLADVGGATIQIWYILAPLTALATTAPLAGSIADLFGRRWTILIGGNLLIIGLILYGTAHTVTQIIVSLPFSGVGAALLEINALAAVNEIAPNKLRGFYTSMLIWTIIPFFPLGIYALELSERATWRWNVWIPLIWCVIGQVMTFFFYHPPPRRFFGKQLSMAQKISKIDFLGVFLSFAGIILFLFGLASGGYTAPWKSVTTLVPLILGFFLLVLLGFWETFARNPLFPPKMFKNARVFTLTLVITAVAGANFFSILILWPKYVLSTFYGRAIAYQGLLIMAQTIGTLFGAGFFSWTITRFKGAIRVQMMLSCLMMMGGLGGLYGVSQNQPYIAGLCVFIGGVGVGGIIVPASVITQLCSPDEYLGTVTALTFVARVIGGAIGFTVYYYVLNHEVHNLFTSYATNKAALACVTVLLKAGLNAAQITTALTSFGIDDTKALLAMKGVTPAVIDQLHRAATPIWAEGFGTVWIVTIAFSGVGLICSAFLGDVSKYMTNHRAVHI
ncbi:protein of unknown function [Taphrina deformans PYCC 5710]|uniref:Major facilitator superfamily (MFS) profile domain-containing protein n=1 Tax=Taphrina deformans (strain PYCC 5710 / ATCC 11124 / CBS 356.35 / IMI 108563 / JCM 9778 / NBRC 8474) TaxID=1097556 RepID=R4XMF8_TAPDE|nr:protein of unknown function [Taphrina deformans PYCC 5710]|eukprot:CCG84490.1 protein of unknown function [Taphrina deformans PYCC 5710]